MNWRENERESTQDDNNVDDKDDGFENGWGNPDMRIKSKHAYNLAQSVFPELTYNMSNNQDMWKNRALPLDVWPDFDGDGETFLLILLRQICG